MRWSGNTGKYRIQRDLLRLIEPTTVLDVGALGTGKTEVLDLWRDLPLSEMPLTIVAADISPQHIERAKALGLPITCEQASGYDLVSSFGEASFDLVITTQVLEHIVKPQVFLDQIGLVLRPGGRLWATCDSGHFSSTHAGDAPWKRWARPIADRFTDRHHDSGLTETEVRSLVSLAALEVDEVMHCNLDSLKLMKNELSEAESQVLIPLWYEFEEALRLAGFNRPEYFRAIYVSAHKSIL
jgi:SAM-dependent methyltransferase